MTSKLIFFSHLFAETNFFRIKLHTERVKTFMNTGNAGYNNFRKLNSSFLRNDAKNYNDKKLPINTTTENSAAPIELSVIILVCLGTIILGLYVASYTIENFTVFKELICGRNTNKRNWFDRNGGCDI